MKCDIYFSNFDSDEINRGGWSCEEGKLALKLTSPLSGGKSIDALDEALDKKKYRFVGSLEVDKPEHAWGVVQNIDNAHQLNDRSMMVGDVIICDGIIGKMVEPMGWSILTMEQIDKFVDTIS